MPPVGATRVLAIDGRAGSGKSTLAAAVSAALGGDHLCPVVAMDDLYEGWSGLAGSVPRLVDEVLVPLSEGREALAPRWDWHAGRWGAPRRLAVTGLLIVEGCGSAVRPASDHAAVTVWLAVPEAVRRERALARDGATFAPFWDQWAEQEEALYTADGTAARADLVVNEHGEILMEAPS